MSSLFDCSLNISFSTLIFSITSNCCSILLHIFVVLKDIPYVPWLYVIPSQQKFSFEFILVLQVNFTIELFFHEFFSIALAIVPFLVPLIFVVASIQPFLTRHNASFGRMNQLLKHICSFLMLITFLPKGFDHSKV